MKTIEDLFTQAQTLHQQGHFDQAHEAYQEILAQQPEHIGSLVGLGLLAAQQQQFETALQWMVLAVTHEPNSAVIHNNLGNIYRALKRFDEAKTCYEQALTLQPNYAEAHNNVANLYLKQDQLQDALKHYVKAVHSRPDYLDAHFNLGLLLVRLEKNSEAIKQFRNVITLNNNHIAAHQQLANLYLNQEQLDKAKHHYEEVLRLDSENVDALNNLGVIHLKKELPQVAVDYFSRALAYDDDNQEIRSNIASTFMHYDRFENAARHYRQLLKQDPDNIETNFNLGFANMALGQLDEAVNFFNHVLKQQPHHVDALCNLAAIYLRKQERNQALSYYERAQLLQPNNQLIRYAIAALTGENVPAAAPDEYVTNLFDNYAWRFDKHLNYLGYQAPKLLRDAVIQLIEVVPSSGVSRHLLPQGEKEKGKEVIEGEGKWKVLDLGCGTGLVGEEFRSLASYLVGVDLSEKMIKEAEKKHLYDALVTCNIEKFFETNHQTFQLIVAADVFCYIGDLDLVFAQCATALVSPGLFAFTVEKNDQDGYVLQPTARFAHNKHYIEMLAANHGFSVIHCTEEAYRKQEGESVPALLFVLQKQ